MSDVRSSDTSAQEGTTRNAHAVKLAELLAEHRGQWDGCECTDINGSGKCALARKWHMAFNAAKRQMTGVYQEACSGPDCEFCLFAASVMTRAPRRTADNEPTARTSQETTDLLRDWREQDRVLQQIAAIVGDEHVTCAADVLVSVQRFAQERVNASPRQETTDQRIAGKLTIEGPDDYGIRRISLRIPGGWKKQALDCDIADALTVLQQRVARAERYVEAGECELADVKGDLKHAEQRVEQQAKEIRDLTAFRDYECDRANAAEERVEQLEQAMHDIERVDFHGKLVAPSGPYVLLSDALPIIEAAREREKGGQ